MVKYVLLPKNILACLGEADIVYIRPVLEDGKTLYGVFTASGYPINNYSTLDQARSAAWLSEMTPLYCH